MPGGHYSMLSPFNIPYSAICRSDVLKSGLTGDDLSLSQTFRGK